MAHTGRWPWQASVAWGSRHMRRGSVLAPRWVLTAAHCVHRQAVPPVRLVSPRGTGPPQCHQAAPGDCSGEGHPPPSLQHPESGLRHRPPAAPDATQLLSKAPLLANSLHLGCAGFGWRVTGVRRGTEQRDREDGEQAGAAFSPVSQGLPEGIPVLPRDCLGSAQTACHVLLETVSQEGSDTLGKIQNESSSGEAVGVCSVDTAPPRGHTAGPTSSSVRVVIARWGRGAEEAKLIRTTCTVLAGGALLEEGVRRVCQPWSFAQARGGEPGPSGTQDPVPPHRHCGRCVPAGRGAGFSRGLRVLGVWLGPHRPQPQ
ncbi:hypothetical protein MC885_017903 [Smutsia gigantea]|nr:hypothetical protein MC885_017903 [Smutsia gigantea]